jgi:hypothetical protein
MLVLAPGQAQGLVAALRIARLTMSAKRSFSRMKHFAWLSRALAMVGQALLFANDRQCSGTPSVYGLESVVSGRRCMELILRYERLLQSL